MSDKLLDLLTVSRVMEICAVILNYFGHSDTIACVESLLAQDGLSRIVIVENSCCSTELTALTETYVGNELVQILPAGKNLGFAGGVDFALESIGIGSFDAFLILNNDTIVPSGVVRTLAESLCERNFDLVAPTIYSYPDTRRIWSKGNYYNRLTGFITIHPIVHLPFSFYFLTGCCLLIRASVFHAVGLFDRFFFMYGEDIEFCFRVSSRGFRLGCISDAAIFHKGSESSGHNSSFYEYHMNRSHLFLCSKLARTPKEANVSLIFKTVTLTLRAMWRTLRYGNANALYGLRLAVAECFGNSTHFRAPGTKVIHRRS